MWMLKKKGKQVMKMPTIINHKNVGKTWDNLCKSGSGAGGNLVTLEAPLGELAKGDFVLDMLFSQTDKDSIKTEALTGKEGFNAQGLEGKFSVRVPLAFGLMVLRRLPPFRGRVLARPVKEVKP